MSGPWLALAIVAVPTAICAAFAAFARRPWVYVPIWLTLSMLALFNYYPAVDAFRTALYRWDIGTQPVYVGLANFRRMAGDPVIAKSFANMALIAGAALAFGLTMPLLAAELIFGLRREAWRFFFRCLFVIPMLVPAVGVFLIWRQIYSDVGPLSGLLERLGLEGWIRGWLSDPATALPAVIGVGFPFVSGFAMLVYYAGLSGIDPSVLDATRLDGAGPLRAFLHIHLPQIVPQVKIIAILTVIGAAQGFENVLVLTDGGGPGYLTMVPGLYMYLEGFSFKRMGYAAAVGLILFLFLLAFTILNLRLMRSRIEEEARRG